MSQRTHRSRELAIGTWITAGGPANWAQLGAAELDASLLAYVRQLFRDDLPISRATLCRQGIQTERQDALLQCCRNRARG